MKHNLQVTIILIILFLLAHLIGLLVVKHYLPESQQLPLKIEKPQAPEETSYIPIFITILIATIAALILIKFSAFRLWKLWFLLSVFLTLTISITAFIPELFAIFIAIILSLWKTFKPNVYIHNFTEIFIYGGLAALFVPILNIKSTIILLILISIYDAIAVWKTKHMISLAKFQSESKIFAGLFIPYNKNSEANKEVSLNKNNEKYNNKISSNVNNAMLGGGDIGFTLLFSGVVLKTFGMKQAIIVSLITSIALLGLFLFAKKDRFYPAMPFLTIGCILGYLMILFI